MLKKSASGVLASFRSSTYPRGYASGLHSLRPCWTAFLSIVQDKNGFPASCYVGGASKLQGAVEYLTPD